jgi:transcriptional regulator of met regulon
VKLCIVTSKCPVFIQKLNDALFEAKPLYTPVQQGDDVLYRNQRMMVCATNADGTMVQLCPTEEDQTIDSNVWISRADIDQKLAKKSRAMSSAETDVMTEVLQRAYDAAVLALENDPTRFVRGEDPAKAIMFYIYLAVMYEMPTYVQPRGVILRNDWQSIVFDGPGVDHDKDNYLTFGDDARCTLTLNSNTKTNANGEQVKRFDISHTRLVEFLRQWEPHARAMQNQTVKTKTRSIQVSARAPYVVCHYSCTHPDVFARPYVMGRSLSAVAGQCSAARQVHHPAGCRAHVLGYSPRPLAVIAQDPALRSCPQSSPDRVAIGDGRRCLRRVEARFTGSPKSVQLRAGGVYVQPCTVGYQEKMQKIVSAILPFTSAATDTPVVEQARSTIGLLEHASNIFVLGKAFFHAMRGREIELNTKGKGRTAPAKAPFKLDREIQHTMDMWHSMVSHATPRSSRIGVE